MARPPKMQRVDYFPHMCIHGKTMFIIEQHYGNDGYAFWFKLLEQLGAENGHALDTKLIHTWEFLQSRARLPEDKCREILDHLARLEAIDRTLWEEHQIIWSQNLVDNLSDIYRKRNCALPLKPGVSGAETTGEAGFPARKPEQTGVSGAESAARIGQDRIGQDRTGSARDDVDTFEADKITSDTPLPPTVQAEWDRLLEIYPKPRGIVKGKDRAVRLFVKSAERARILRNARNYSCSSDVARGFVVALDRFVEGAFRDYDEPEQDVQPSGAGPPGPNAILKDLEEASARVKAERAQGIKRPPRPAGL